MSSLRTPESEKKYKDLVAQGILDQGCALCKGEAKKSFEYWKIMENAFPYDRIAGIHDMIVPVRHVSEQELSDAELQEFQKIKDEVLNEKYEYIIEATPKKKSIPAHFHLHLIIAKE